MTRRPSRALRALFVLAALGLASGALAAPLPYTASPQAYRATLPSVLPVPRQATYPEGTLGLDGLTVRLEGTAPELVWAARDLDAEVRARLGRPLLVASAAGSGRAIRIGTLRSADLAARAAALGLTPDRPEGYALWVDRSGAAVVGFDALGAYRGAQTLRQLLTSSGFRFAAVRDWPEFGTRMAMIYLDQFSRPVNDILIPLLARLKYSHLLVVSDYVQWDSTRTIWHPQGATKAEARRVAGLIRAYGMEPVPLIETLSHTNWLFYNGQNKDLYQDPASSNPFAYDTLNPRTYSVILPILTEAVEVFRPKFIHIGHDEVRGDSSRKFPARPDGLAVGFEKLFLDDTLKLYSHLKSLGVGTMIWHDTALSDASKAVLLPALPKDILLANWHYNPGDDFPTIREAQAAGFRAVGASWYREGNPETFARSAARDKAYGMLQTRWSGYFGNPSIFDGQAEQGVAYLNAAASFWNPAAPVPPDVGARYRDGWRAASLAPISGRVVDLSTAVTRTLADPDETGWLQKGPGIDLSSLPVGPVRFGAPEFIVRGAVMTRGSRAAVANLPASVTLELSGKAAALAMLHATGWPAASDRQKVGSYTLAYADGSSVTLPLEYGRHISAWTDTQLRSVFAEPVWRGLTGDELGVGLNALVWANPYPDRALKSLTLTSEGGQANPILIGLSLLDGVPRGALGAVDR